MRTIKLYIILFFLFLQNSESVDELEPTDRLVPTQAGEEDYEAPFEEFDHDALIEERAKNEENEEKVNLNII